MPVRYRYFQCASWKDWERVSQVSRTPEYKIKNTNHDQDDNLLDLIEALEDIDLEQPNAKLNEISIADNNGGRILF